MPLAGANARYILTERKALLVAGGHDMLELIQSEGDPVAFHGLQQFGDTNPPTAVEFKANPFRFVPENQAEEFAGSDDFFVGHYDIG